MKFKLSDLPTRLSSKIEVSNSGCWLWTASVQTSTGYGQVATGDDIRVLLPRSDHGKKTYRAHRLVYRLLVGPVPEGLVLDHTCNTKRCCNPAHLEPVTHQENLARAPAKRTKRVTPLQRRLAQILLKARIKKADIAKALRIPWLSVHSISKGLVAQ